MSSPIKKSKRFKRETFGSEIFTPQICCGGKQTSEPSRWRSQFNRRLCAAKTLGIMLGGRSILERCERAGWLTPVRRGKRLTLFKRDDIEAAQLRVSWGELTRIVSIVTVSAIVPLCSSSHQ
jgi:hypothetical protein